MTIRPRLDQAKSLALFPYVSMRSDPRGRTPLVMLTERIHIALLHVQAEGSRVLYREDVEALHLDPVSAYLEARERLSRLVRARLVTVRVVRGPWGARCLAFQHSFLAASCLVLPNLHELARARLKADRLCMAAPRRDLLLVLPDLGGPFRVAARDVLGSRGVPDEHTNLFALEPSGPGTLQASSRTSMPVIACAHPTRDEQIPIDIDDGEIGDGDPTAAVRVTQAMREGDGSDDTHAAAQLRGRAAALPRSSYTAFHAQPRPVRLDSVERAV